ncbi:hypothetical protein [Pontibacillus marinus]|uniref:Uncharacterized protein n=1 Tax=Pontibacillus marinus BH030004 = DSM 16465 TaxID=1385511 RepID=A0A0A5GI91_9BACI|nr:hypothetical protein [Pontibacillus marinus]KGX90845.1 hypothetical protein N783_18540 [Pontibacillus marinus BH030004 = DSM 16465]
MKNKRTNSGGMLDLPHTLLRSLTIPTSTTTTDSSSNNTKPKPKDLTSLFDDLNKQSKYDTLYFLGQNEEKKTSTPTFLNEKIELPQLSDKTVKLLQNTSSQLIDRTIEKISANIAGKFVNKEGMNHMSDDKKSSTLSNMVEGILQDEGIQDSIKQIAESMKSEENQDKNHLSEDALQDVLNHPEVQRQINDLFKKMKEE